MKREYLEGLGLDKDQIDKIMAEHGKSVEAQKSKVTDLTANVADLQGQISQRDKDIKDLKEQAGDNADLQTKLTNLEKQYTDDKSALETKLHETSLASAIKLALNGKVHDAGLVIDQLDKTTIELDDKGNVIKGLDEQIKTLQESKSFLFVPEPPGNTFKGVKPVDGTPPGGQEGAQKENLGKMLADQAKGNAEMTEARNSYFG